MGGLGSHASLAVGKAHAKKKKTYTAQDFKQSLTALAKFNCQGAKDVAVLCQETRGLVRNFKVGVKKKNMKLFRTYFTQLQGQLCTKVTARRKRFCSVMALLGKNLPK